MDSFWIVVFFIILSVVFDKLGSKKKPVPKIPPPGRPLPPRPPVGQGRPRSLGFEVPQLEGAPEERPAAIQDAQGVWYEADPMLQEQRQAWEEAERDRIQDEAREQRERAAREEEARVYAAQAKLPGRSVQQVEAPSPEQLRAAVIWSEILGKPKALRRR